MRFLLALFDAKSKDKRLHTPYQTKCTECEMIQEGNEASAFDDDELGIQVVQMLGRRCSVSFPCSSILQYLCLHVKVWKNKFVPPQVRSVCTRVQDLALRNAYTIFSTYLTNVTKGLSTVDRVLTYYLLILLENL